MVRVGFGWQVFVAASKTRVARLHCDTLGTRQAVPVGHAHLTVAVSVHGGGGADTEGVLVR